MTQRYIFLSIDLGGGGAERVLVSVAEGVPGPCEILLIGSKRTYPTFLPVSSLNVGLSDASGPAQVLESVYQAATKLRKFLRAHRGARVVSFGFWPNLLNVWATGSKAILSEHTTPSMELRQSSAYSVFAMLLRVTYRRASHIIAVSEGTKKDLVSNFGIPADRITVVHNPVDISELQAKAAAPVSPEWAQLFRKRRVVVTAGRLEPPKGHIPFVRAFAQVKAMVPEAALVILGEGSLREQTSRAAAAAGLRVSSDPAVDGDVFLPGFVENPFAVMKQAELFVFPSVWEGFGNGLVEALACGLPVVASDCESGPREIVAPKYRGRQLTQPLTVAAGVLLPPFTDAFADQVPLEALWAEQVAELMNDEPRRQQAASLAAESVERFSSDTILLQWRAALGASSTEAP